MPSLHTVFTFIDLLFSKHVQQIVLGQDILSPHVTSSRRLISNVNSFYKELFPLPIVGNEDIILIFNAKDAWFGSRVKSVNKEWVTWVIAVAL